MFVVDCRHHQHQEGCIIVQTESTINDYNFHHISQKQNRQTASKQMNVVMITTIGIQILASNFASNLATVWLACLIVIQFYCQSNSFEVRSIEPLRSCAGMTISSDNENESMKSSGKAGNPGLIHLSDGIDLLATFYYYLLQSAGNCI